MNIRPIKTESDYRLALQMLDNLFDAPIGTPESDEADLLGLMIDEYEKEHYGYSGDADPPSPVILTPLLG